MHLHELANADLGTERNDDVVVALSSDGIALDIAANKPRTGSGSPAAAIREALDNNEFSIEFVPVLDLVTGEMAEAEACAVWNHPTFGSLDPIELIEAVAGTAVAFDFGMWMLRTAASTWATWLDTSDANFKARLAVDLPPEFFQRKGAAEDVLATVEDAGLEPSQFVVEIRESAQLADPVVIDNLKRLRSRSVSIAIDDFGSGYSSLSHLHCVPVDIIKLGTEFVANVDAGGYGQRLTDGIVTLLHDLGLRIVATGLGSLAQIDHLTRLGCAFGQGNLVGRRFDLSSKMSSPTLAS